MAADHHRAERRGDKLRGDDAKPANAGDRADHAAQPPARRPTRMPVAQLCAIHSFVTDSRSTVDTKAADAYHRNHATVRARHQRPQLKAISAMLSRCLHCVEQFVSPTRDLARLLQSSRHNLARWAARLGRTHPARQCHRRGHHRATSAPHRAGQRLVNHSHRHRLRLPLNAAMGTAPITTALQQMAYSLPQLKSEPPATAPGAATAEPHPPPTRTSPTPQILHAPKRAGPHLTRTSPAATRPNRRIP